MRRPRTYTALEDLGRQRLSRYFTMRDFLHSEIGAFFGRDNIPDDPDLALMAGRGLAEHCLDPLVETFGPIDIRSGFRSCDLNHFGATAVTPQKCAANAKTCAGHIWDRRDAEGRMGACASVVVPWFAAQYNRGRDWRDLAWWLLDHLPLQSACFFPKNAAFNLTWNEGWLGPDAPPARIDSYATPKGLLTGPGRPPDPGRAAHYADFPPFRGIAYPAIPETWP